MLSFLYPTEQRLTAPRGANRYNLTTTSHRSPGTDSSELHHYMAYPVRSSGRSHASEADRSFHGDSPTTFIVHDPPRSAHQPSRQSTSDASNEVEEDSWNLIPYAVPNVPGDASSPAAGSGGLFLRSPTPLKYQRAVQACDQCRERKAKVRLALPSCCLSQC
jgi:hypothetical protein